MRLLILLATVATAYKVLLYGDSLTYFAFQMDGWATLLHEHFKESITLINNGTCGFCTDMALTDLKPSLELVAHDKKNPLILTTILLGTNDAYLPETGYNRTVPVGRYEENIRYLTNTALAYGKVALITPPPLDILHMNDRVNTDVYRDACIKVANETGVILIDSWKAFFGPLGTYDQTIVNQVLNDGVHFNANGNFLLYQHVLEVTQKVLNER
ncbi:SGNH hydrolase-type esterase domain-containing protein [Globomyces pollinis-pini]|nr:SGNH hydrolase-type esterase domain-containing protein [Globomyces pollinis-pini]